MSSIFKTILGIFISIVIVYSGLGIIGANNDANAASSYLEYISNEIAASNFSQEVIDELIAEASTSPNDYELKVTTKGTENTNRYAELELTYTYRIKLLGVESEHVLKRIAK